MQRLHLAMDALEVNAATTFMDALEPSHMYKLSFSRVVAPISSIAVNWRFFLPTVVYKCVEFLLANINRCTIYLWLGI